MNSPAVDIQSYLASLSGLGLTIGDNLHSSDMPDSPDFCVSVYDTGGEFGDPRYNFDIVRIQIRFRGDPGDYRSIYDLALSIQRTLDGASSLQIGGTKYIAIYLMTAFQFIGYDSKKRPLATMNFRINRTTT
jgi:hypothetical protein